MYPIFKRLFDIVVSVFLLLVFSPLFLVLILLLSLTGEKKVFYLQERVGYKNRRFKIWKFATMLQNSPNMGTGDITVKNDPRLIPMGKFLRKTKLNEIPQLINVLVGSMSLVGPRPLMVKGFARYSADIQSKIYNVKPGITGIGSVIFRDEESIVSRASNYNETYNKINAFKGELEFWYQKNISFKTDASIMFLTVWVLLFHDSNLPNKFFSSLPKLDKDNFLQKIPNNNQSMLI